MFVDSRTFAILYGIMSCTGETTDKEGPDDKERISRRQRHRCKAGRARRRRRADVRRVRRHTHLHQFLRVLERQFQLGHGNRPERPRRDGGPERRLRDERRGRPHGGEDHEPQRRDAAIRQAGDHCRQHNLHGKESAFLLSRLRRKRHREAGCLERVFPFHQQLPLVFRGQ